MATNVSGVTSHFPDAENGFTTTTAGSIASAAVTVPLNSVSGYTNGQPVVLVIDPTDPAKKQTFTGIVDTSGVQITSVVWTAGTNQIHALGATVVDYATATHIAMISKGIQVEHEQDGTHGVEVITSRTEDTNPDPDADFLLTYDTSATALKKVKPSSLGIGDSWVRNSLPAVSSVTENGNRSADITFASTVASLLTPGMRIRTSRTVAAPTYVGGLFNGSSQYFTKVTCTSTLSTVTDNFTIVANILPTTYPAARAYICGRSDATPNNGFGMFIEPSGQIGVIVFNAATANLRSVLSYQSISVLKRQHIAVTWAAGVVTMYLDGVSIPVATATTGGTAPTTAGTGGDWSIGRFGAFGAYSSGYISGVGVFNAVLSASTIRSYKNQVLSGSETNCIGAWSLNNTGVNQQAAGTNDLTAVNSVSYSAGVSPYCTDSNGVAAGTYDWAIVTKVATTVATVQYPEGCAIPTSGGISTVDYSGVKAPFGMPVSEDKWTIAALYKASGVQSSPVSGTWYNMSSSQLNIPIGNWAVDYATILYVAKGGTAGTAFATLSTTSSTESDAEFSSGSFHALTGDNAYFQNRQKTVSPTSATPYYLNAMFNTTGATTLQFYVGVPYQIRAKLAYL